MQWLIGAALAIQVGLLLLRFAWVWVSLRMTVFKGPQPTSIRGRLHGRVVMVMSLAGVRGAVTLAGVMTLPYLMPDGSPFPLRPLLLFLATTVILSSLLIASLALPLLLDKLAFPRDGVEQEQETLARKEAALAALAAISATQQRLANEGFDVTLVDGCADKVIETYETRAEGNGPGEHPMTSPATQADQSARAERMLRIAAWTAERDRIMELLRQTIISDEVSRKLVREIDLQESREV
jgi:NhaP-type Na+/H+ or K+/H+ antiporter